MKAGERIRALAAIIDGRSLSERRLLSAASVIVLATAWFALLQAPLRQQLESTRQELVAAGHELAAERAGFEEMQRLLQNDPHAQRRAQLERTRQELQRLDTVLAERALKIVSPTQMVQALRDVLERQRGLRLQSLENLPVEPAFRLTDGTPATTDVPSVYRHRVRMELHGDYLAVLRYLDALEQLPWRFQWDSFAIETDAYPVARVVMYLSTLSLGESWIGT